MSDKWLNKLNNDPTLWLLESNPWTKYKTLIDLLDKSESLDEVKKAKKEPSPWITFLCCRILKRWYEK